MANPTFNVGLKPVSKFSGSVDDGNIVKMLIPAAYNTAVHLFDPIVEISGSNTAAISTCSGKYAIGSLPLANLATLGTGDNKITGVIVGFEKTPAQVAATTFAGQGKYGVASTDRVVFVRLAHDTLFHVRDDGGAALSSTAVGKNAVLIAGTGNTTTTGISGVKLDAGTTTAPAANNPTFQLRIVGIADIPNNVPGVGCVWVVKVNNDSHANIVNGV